VSHGRWPAAPTTLSETADLLLRGACLPDRDGLVNIAILGERIVAKRVHRRMRIGQLRSAVCGDEQMDGAKRISPAKFARDLERDQCAHAVPEEGEWQIAMRLQDTRERID